MKPHKKSFFGWRVWLVIICAALIAFFVWRFYFNDSGGTQRMAPAMPPVRDAVAVLQPVPYYLNGLGTVIPSGDVLVQSRVDGQLLKLHFVDGQRVKAGDLLAEIDPRPFQAALGQAQGNLGKDMAQLENARRDLARYAKLAKGDYIAEQQYENQRSLVRQYEGTVEADKAAVDSAKLQLEYSRIKAPISGRLGLRNADEGNQIKANDAAGIVRITETSPCDVIFTIPESQVNLVTQALAEREINPEMPPLRVEAWDRQQKELLDVGELLSLDNQIDAATGTVKLKARFPNADNQLFPNQFINAKLLVKTIPGAVTVPQAAVQLGSKGSYIYVLKPEESPGKDAHSKKGNRQGGPDNREDIIRKVEYREITPGITAFGAQVIDGGLNPGEQVVVDGVDRLRDGILAKVAATMETPVTLPDFNDSAFSRFNFQDATSQNHNQNNTPENVVDSAVNDKTPPELK